MDWNPLNWPTDIIGKVLGTAAGDISTGLSIGLMAFFNDIWDITSGPFYIIAGAAVGIAVLSIYFASGKTGQALISTAARAAV